MGSRIALPHTTNILPQQKGTVYSFCTETKKFAKIAALCWQGNCILDEIFRKNFANMLKSCAKPP